MIYMLPKTSSDPKNPPLIYIRLKLVFFIGKLYTISLMDMNGRIFFQILSNIQGIYPFFLQQTKITLNFKGVNCNLIIL